MTQTKRPPANPVRFSTDGRLAQFTLANRAGETLRFVLSYRQIGYLASMVQSTGQKMREILASSSEAAAAEVLLAVAQPYAVKSCAVHERDGEPVLWVELEEGGAISIAMDRSVAAAALTELVKSRPGTAAH